MSSTTIPGCPWRPSSERVFSDREVPSCFQSGRWRVGSVLLVAALLAPPAFGNPSDAPLTLDRAIDAALANNFAVQRAASEVRVRQGDAVHAGRSVPSNPVLEARTARRDGPGGQSTDFGITISQSLFTGGKGKLAENAARNRQGEAEQRLDFLRTTVAARTRSAFLQVLSAQERLNTAERLMTLNREVHDFARRRLQAGEGTRLEVNAAAISVGRAKAELAKARQRLAAARLALTEQLAVDPAQSVAIRGRLEPARLVIDDTDILLRQAMQRRADLAAAARSVAAARDELRLSERQLVPNVTVGAFYDRENSNDVLGLSLSAPIPALHRFQGEQRSAQARLDRAQIEQDALRQQVRREVLMAVAAYRSARERVEVFGSQMVANAEENLVLTRGSVDAGQLGAPAITTAQNNLMEVRRQYLTALDDLISAGAALERSTGGLLRLAPTSSTESRENPS
ncbi:TolC family protein [Guyparkeria sp. 1SP6A2]|nr:TolC family protein [Guyparkeria sp. 1SP6A2]